MTHPGSGNSSWQDWPSTETPVDAASLERIETALDATLPGAWQALTMQNDWQGRDIAMGTTSFYAPASRRLPTGSVEVVGTIYRATGAASGTTVALLPVGHRPVRELEIVATDSAGYSVNITVRPTGALDVSSHRTTATTLTFTGQFPLNGPT